MEATPFARIVIRSTGNQKLPYFVSPCNVPFFFYARAARFTIEGLHDPADLPLLRKNCVSAVVSKQFASKACSRPDLLAVIDKQWDIVRIATSASV